MLKHNRIVLAIAGAVFLAIVALEMAAPANIVGAYGFVLPILLVATVRSRVLMLVTVVACIVATYMGLMQPTKPGRFQSAVINRSVVAGMLLVVAYIGMTWEERKAREEAARAALAQETENLLKANTQLVDAKDQLNRSERLAAVGQLVASVAHEVGTPLHSIAWHVQALAEEPGVTPEMKKRVTIIDEQLTRVVRIIQDLLSSTRPRQPEPDWLPVEQVISPAAVLMEPAFHAKGISLTVEIPVGLPLVWADAEKIHQVLVNLLANALAATPPHGAVRVVLGTRAASSDELDLGRRVAEAMSPLVITVAVRDPGCGMPSYRDLPLQVMRGRSDLGDREHHIPSLTLQACMTASHTSPRREPGDRKYRGIPTPAQPHTAIPHDDRRPPLGIGDGVVEQVHDTVGHVASAEEQEIKGELEPVALAPAKHDVEWRFILGHVDRQLRDRVRHRHAVVRGDHKPFAFLPDTDDRRVFELTRIAVVHLDKYQRHPGRDAVLAPNLGLLLRQRPLAGPVWHEHLERAIEADVGPEHPRGIISEVKLLEPHSSALQNRDTSDSASTQPMKIHAMMMPSGRLIMLAIVV